MDLGHVTASELVVIFVALAYVTSLVRDWRPIRTLREENKELRRELASLQQKHDALEVLCQTLEKSRDFEAVFEQALHAIEETAAERTREHAKILEAFDTHEQHETAAWNELQRGLAANTSALSVLAAGINADTLPRKTS